LFADFSFGWHVSQMFYFWWGNGRSPSRVLMLKQKQKHVKQTHTEPKEKSTNQQNHVRFEVFTVVAMKNGIFWDVMPCGFCKNHGGT
jgi:hypothetical protein